MSPLWSLLVVQAWLTVSTSGLGESSCKDTISEEGEAPIVAGEQGSRALLQRTARPFREQLIQESQDQQAFRAEFDAAVSRKKEEDEADSSGNVHSQRHHTQKDGAARVVDKRQAQTRAPATSTNGTVDNTKALEFCNKDSLLHMHGVNHSAGAREKFQQDILDDISQELSSNNVDQMAKDIFSFYICVRWVPDQVFWSVAKEELTNDIIKSVVDHQEGVEQAISELYQTFKFVPLLCSRNLAVYSERNSTTGTYYDVFKQKVEGLSHFVSSSKSKAVWQSLKNVDESYCNSDRMHSTTCNTKVGLSDWLSQVGQKWDWLSSVVQSRQDRWAAMHLIFESFKLRATPEEHTWDTDFLAWKEKFPYHSFIAKPGGTSPQASPKSTERFLVCFGKRVASDMHRRPTGNNIITDQNAVGCHGWWDEGMVTKMLTRTAALWKPPTCQLAEKTYEMKKQILRMYAQMNQDLYGALPSMLQDEKLFEQGLLEEALAGPPPYNVASAQLGSDTYYTGMRVAKVGDTSIRKADCPWWQPSQFCSFDISHGDAGNVVVEQGRVRVLWDTDPENKNRDVSANDIQVVPQEYGRSVGGVIDTVRSGLSTAGSWFSDLYRSVLGDSYTNIAEMMTNSLTKWVVCGISENVSYNELDTWLGTEDEALQEHVNEAYAQWSGYEAKVPGEECLADPLVSSFPSCKVCDFSELHVDHPEKYWREDGQKEEFMCPLVPPMSPADQLKVFKDKKKCLLHMTQEQQRQFQWHYQGHHPARKQNNRQENSPRAEYQYVKLLDISSDAGPQQISFAKACSVDEMQANPRFCLTPQLQNPWDSVGQMAEQLSQWLGGALGMPYGAIADMVGNYQRVLSQNATGSDKAKDAAIAFGEQAWDALLGLGRLAHSAAKSAGNEVLYSLPDSNLRHARLEKELFGFGHGGELLHGASYQVLGSIRNTTSNSRERYRRYAVSCDCDDFDPGLALALRWEWSEVALRMIREAARHDSRILDEPVPTVEARGEARLFWRQNEETTNRTHFNYGAAIRPVVSSPGPAPVVQCDSELSWTGRRCIPADKCELESWWSTTCRPKPGFAATNADVWKVVWDGKLSESVGGNPVSLQDGISSLTALAVHFHCGPKQGFGATGGASQVPSSLRSCVEAGVKSNAARRASEPWRLYFPEEVVVVAEFGTLGASHCLSTNDATKSLLCASGAVEDANLDKHLPADAKLGGAGGGEYRGLRTGSGFPKGTVREVVLRPEDILSVNGLLTP